MANQTNVLADGLETGSRTPEAGSRWGWLAAGLLVGFGLAFLLFGANPQETAPVPTPHEDGGLIEGTDSGIGEAVPGFKDGLVAITTSDGSTLDYSIWPVAGPEYERGIPLGTATTRGQVTFDASGRRIATMHFVPGETFSGLAFGVPEVAQLVDIGVTGYAWHDSIPGSIAYTTFEDGVLGIWTMDITSTEPMLFATPEATGGGLAAWGDWGFAVQNQHYQLGDGGQTVTILSPQGQELESFGGRLLASHESGLLVVVDEEIKLIGTAAGTRDFDDRFAVVGNPLTAAISPDGRKLAVLGNAGLLVLPIEGDSAVVQAEPLNGVAQVAWSSDNRFVLVPGTRGITVVDTRSSRLDHVFGDRTVLGVSILPISD